MVIVSNMFNLFLLLVSAIKIFDFEPSSNWIFHVSILSLIWLIILSVKNSTKNISMITYEFSFGIVLFLFHITNVILSNLDEESNLWVTRLNQYWVELGFWHMLMALSAYSLGASITKRKRINKIGHDQIFQIKKIGWNMGLGLLLASCVLLVLAFASYGNLLEYSRADIFSAKVDTRGFGVFTMFAPSAMILLFISAYNKTTKTFALITLFLISSIFLFTGYRTYALFPLLVGLILWEKQGKKVPRLLLVCGVVVVLLLISAVGYLRGLGKIEEINNEALSESFEKASVYASLEGMGNSGSVVAESLRLIEEENEPFRYGRSYFYAFKSAIPNIGATIDTSRSRPEMLNRIQNNPDDVVHMAPSDWLTLKVLGRWHYDRGFGTGFSAIAEAYINFGVIGIVIIFAMFGFFMRKLDVTPLFASPWMYIFMTTISWHFLVIVRNDFSIFTKPAGFIIIVMIFFGIFLRIIGKEGVFSKRKNKSVHA